MQFIKELGAGLTKKGLLYEQNGEKIVLLKEVRKSKRRSFIWQARKEANITQKLPQHMRCDIRTVRVKRLRGEWEVTAHYVEGEPLTRELFATLSAEQKDKLVADFAEFLLTLHSLPVCMMDERYADETDGIGIRYLLGAFFYKLFCFKKDYLSLKKPWKNPYGTRAFRRLREKLYRSLSFAPQEIEWMEQAVADVCHAPDLFAYIGVCMDDFSGSNFLYDKQTERLGALDLCCPYKGNLYYDFSNIYWWMGKEFLQALIAHYNTLATQREVHLPKSKAYPLRIEYAKALKLRAVWLLQRAAKFPDCKDEIIDLLHEIYSPAQS